MWQSYVEFCMVTTEDGVRKKKEPWRNMMTFQLLPYTVGLEHLGFKKKFFVSF